MSALETQPLPRRWAIPLAGDLILILSLALAVRLLTFNGAFGSDDLTYFGRAASLAGGEWTTANDNGAVPY